MHKENARIFHDYKSLSKAIENHRSLSKKIVFTNGCFDILHRGHVAYLEKAKSFGDILVVGINSDNSVKKLKGKNRPLIGEEDRAYIVSMLKPVDYVCIFDELTPEKLIASIVPDILVKGGDYKIEEVVGRDIVEKKGGKVIIAEFLKGYSSTSIIEKINKLKS